MIGLPRVFRTDEPATFSFCIFSASPDGNGTASCPNHNLAENRLRNAPFKMCFPLVIPGTRTVGSPSSESSRLLDRSPAPVMVAQLKAETPHSVRAGRTISEVRLHQAANSGSDSLLWSDYHADAGPISRRFGQALCRSCSTSVVPCSFWIPLAATPFPFAGRPCESQLTSI